MNGEDLDSIRYLLKTPEAWLDYGGEDEAGGPLYLVSDWHLELFQDLLKERDKLHREAVKRAKDRGPSPIHPTM